MKGLFRLLLSLAAIVSVAGLACAANKVSLSCAATYASKESQFQERPMPAGGLVIDFDRGTVASLFGSFFITNVTETHVGFEAPARDPKVRPTEGLLDRHSGSGNVIAWRDANTMLYVIRFACKRADPLF